MSDLNIPLLSDICAVPGAPGFEKPVRDLVLKEIEGLVDEVSTDNMGNVIAIKRGKSSEKRSMAAAHMDEIGFIVKHIDDKGFLRFHTLGGFDPKTLSAQRVIVHGKKPLVGVMGSKPIHIMQPEERTKAAKITDYFIDLGMPVDEVNEHISIGDSITRDRELIEMGTCVNCKSLDNRVSVFILIEVLRKMQVEGIKPDYDFVAAFTVQEEVGLRGAHVAAHAAEPDFSFGLDTTIAYDVPGSKPEERCTELGKGAAIKIMDSSTICDVRMVAYMKEIARKHEISWQPEILPAGGTDTASLQRMVPGGSIAGAVSIPTRHIHQVIEMCDKSDIQCAIDLLCASATELASYDFSS